MKNLVTVNLSCNKLTNYPKELNQLKKLDAVDLHGNSIKVIPDGIKSCSALEINLNKNQVTCVYSRLIKSINFKDFLKLI